ncbi:hypothetical protein [Pectobacterium odoriferum]|uniref:hypothetical protein n=1 Tax=Pectobacterium odoriferum TaxID=78398 RepID=UPI000500CE35|nr:hypothetical protein [Pectobacterium odoriferum]KGA30251.1 hypothetical protein KS43_20425 [Pectobacterium odoriferum]
MLNTDERLYYAGAGETLKAILIQAHLEEKEEAFADKAKQIATAVRDAYLILLDVPLPQRGGDYDVELSRKIARNLKHFLATDDMTRLTGDVNQAD